MLINKHKRLDLNLYNCSKAFIKYLNNMDYIYENIEECNANTERKILIFFDDMIADMLSNKEL